MNNITRQKETTTEVKKLRTDITTLIAAIVAGAVGNATLAEQVLQTTELTNINANTLSLLNNLVASQDVEILLVRDTGAADVVVQQIREYDQGTGVWTTRYEDVSGTPYVPVGPLEYLDPSAVLNLMLVELQNILAQLDVDLSTRASEATLLATNVLLTTIDIVLDNIKLDTANLDVALSTVATEVTLSAIETLITTIDAVLDAIKLDTANLDVALSTRASEATLSTISGNVSDIEALLVKSNLYKMKTEANDLVETYTWLNGGTADQRVSTIVYSSTALALSVTETFTYNGGAGTYHVATSTLS